jgi:hypothetical protein
MAYVCKDCDSENIVWDAWVSCDGDVVASFDCGSTNIEHDVDQAED